MQNQTPAQDSTGTTVGIIIKIPLLDFRLQAAPCQSSKETFQCWHVKPLKLAPRRPAPQIPGRPSWLVFPWCWLPQVHLHAAPQPCCLSCYTAVVRVAKSGGRVICALHAAHSTRTQLRCENLDNIY